MTFQEYQSLAMRTYTKREDDRDDLVAAAMGVCGEAGEFTDALKKVRFHKHDLDREHLASELGDVMWYVAFACHLTRVSMDAVARRNMAKLHLRYGKQFTVDQSLRRNDAPLPPLDDTPLDISGYHADMMSVALVKGDETERLLEGALGLCGEAGEVAEIIKKHRYQGHALDLDHLTEELGDVLWYVMWSSDTLKVKLSDIASLNVDKLRKRYPQGFTYELSRKAHGIPAKEVMT